MMDFMMRRFDALDSAEEFADRVDGTIVYVSEFGFWVVRW